MATTGGAPQIKVEPEAQAMTHEQLRAHAEAAHGQLAATGPTSGMRPEHSAILNAALGRTRTLLAGLAGINANGVAACEDFGTTETNNEQAVSGLANDIPAPI